MSDRIRWLFAGACCLGLIGAKPAPGAQGDPAPSELSAPDGEPDGGQERQAAGGCDADCDDNNPCTTDQCLGCFGGTCIGACAHTQVPNGTPCSDGLFCNGVDTCSAGACQHPGNPCLGGAVCANCCQELLDSCSCVVFSPCDDGVFCNGPDQCSSGGCSVHAGDPCPGPDGDANCSRASLPPCPPTPTRRIRS